MKHLILGTLLGATLAIPASAQSAGDASVGEADFRKCKACHMIETPDGEQIVRGGRTGPNLWGIVGRKIGSYEGFKYGAGIKELAEMKPDMVWTEEDLIGYVTNPTAWLEEQTGDSGARSKMTFRLTSNQADMAAYLASVSPDAAE
ncbi:c-type cytochrome [Paracoccus fistulariae]|uniref:Cytochrome C n=1 Tax=Paracoccus fistulariae TaxID=658446 RepID=A0ABY7SP05_9RHOB|nr:cytochrome C [Paracoccus fistulariae]MDB6182411.1 cytochrome C [Paracoccus fistulariae]WCR08614.1 cytochrome C [Paracoccus fistulariae]